MIDVNKGLVKKTIWFSLIVQIIIGVVSLHGFFVNIPEKDIILKDILGMETVVQFVELFFYIWIAFAVVSVKDMASRRYIDWFITTPVMLISTIIFMKYNEIKGLGEETFTIKDFFEENKVNIIAIVLLNLGMLLFGYLGEINILPKEISVSIGFIFFLASFYIIYKDYAVKTDMGKKLFYFMFTIWSLYGIAAVAPPDIKNTSYNILDIIAKNFYGLFIYYKILQLSCNGNFLSLCKEN
jgi:bacteriorhodopsin